DYLNLVEKNSTVDGKRHNSSLIENLTPLLEYVIDHYYNPYDEFFNEPKGIILAILGINPPEELFMQNWKFISAVEYIKPNYIYEYLQKIEQEFEIEGNGYDESMIAKLTQLLEYIEKVNIYDGRLTWNGKKIISAILDINPPIELFKRRISLLRLNPRIFLHRSDYKVIRELEKLIAKIEKFSYFEIPYVSRRDLLCGLESGLIYLDNHVIGLSLVESGLTSLPENISKLKSLEVLNVQWNKFTTLPESIGNLKSLKELSLVESGLTSLPESIGNLDALKKLYLGRYDNSSNELKELPESIGNLQSLELLDLDSNELKELPESIGNLQSLKYLDLSFNKLKKLPKSIGNLHSLKELHLWRNELASISESAKKALTNLCKNGCCITGENIAECVLNKSEYDVIKELEEILDRKIDVVGKINYEDNDGFGDKEYEVLKDTSFRYRNLHIIELNLNKSKLTHLPESIGRLQSLKKLYLNDNELVTLPNSISNLKLLEILDLRNNKLTSLPKNIDNLHLLKELRVRGNELASMSENIGNLHL
ncbi:MAG: leucine-rich repeat domain-containing protein, partial [Promethearchaeota archaeon]